MSPIEKQYNKAREHVMTRRGTDADVKNHVFHSITGMSMFALFALFRCLTEGRREKLLGRSCPHFVLGNSLGEAHDWTKPGVKMLLVLAGVTPAFVQSKVIARSPRKFE